MNRPATGLHRVCAAVAAAGALVVLGAFVPVSQAAASGARWRFEPALVPPPPPGVATASEYVDVGPVGQISFWAPNRGLLIEGGTGALGGGTPAVPAGLYAYNGASWHLLSDECGGAEGRIAWAGPDEFWTISDQRGGQELPEKFRTELRSISLCHFLDGQIVGSYAMPLGEAGSYLKMDAAACYGPANCWFGGETGTGEHPGAFHLHWDGTGVSVVYDQEAHAVTGMVGYDGELLESVQMRGGGIAGEPEHPALFHTIASAGSSPFSDLYLFSLENEEPLPAYEKRGLPYVPEGFRLASDGLGLGREATQLWAVSNPEGERYGRSPTVLRCERETCLSGSWRQLMPGLASFAGSEINSAPAPEPGSEDAWISISSIGKGERQPEVAQLSPAEVLRRVALPEAEEAEVGERGAAGPITCPAPSDCWMATSEGWLYHYTDGAPLPVDQDPSFAGVITYRPLDAGVSTIYPDAFVEEASAPPPAGAAPVAPPRPTQPAARRAHGRALVTHVHARYVHGHEFVLTFTLTGKARVSLEAQRGKRVVARIPVRTLRPGRHTLSFTFDPARPPTKLQFKATPPGSHGSAGAESGGGGPEAGSGAGNTIET